MLDDQGQRPTSAGPDAQSIEDLISQIIASGELPGDAIGPQTAREPVQLDVADSAPAAVITAVIDGGLPIGHARFRSAILETRIEYAWIQDGIHTPPSFVPFGREFTKPAIDQLLADNFHAGQVDEDAFYRQTGQADFGSQGRVSLGHRASHGAHVMDLAAGRPVGDPDINDNPIICVQLPETVIADTSGGSLEPYFLAALEYIRDRADRIAFQRGGKRLPLVINFSFGFIAGPHDGTLHLERVMDQFIADRTPETKQTAIVLPSGNRYLSQCHVRLGEDQFDENGICTLSLRIQPDDQTPSYVEFWMPQSNGIPASSRIEMTVTPPGGSTSKVISEIDGDLWEWRPDGPGGEVLCTFSYRYFAAPTGRGRFYLSVQATSAQDGTVALAPSGNWTITVRNLDLPDTEWLDGWVQRDDTLFGDIRRGRQSYFRGPDYEVFNPPGTTPVGGIKQTDSGPSPIRRDGLINAMATGDRTIVAAGFQYKSGQPALYSAGGYTLNPDRLSPDVAAASDTSPVHSGIIAAGTRSGSVTVQGGTSVAAPRLTRRIAAHFASGQGLDRATVAQWGVADEAIFADRPPPPPVLRAESGRVATDTGRDLKRIDFP